MRWNLLQFSRKFRSSGLLFFETILALGAILGVILSVSSDSFSQIPLLSFLTDDRSYIAVLLLRASPLLFTIAAIRYNRRGGVFVLAFVKFFLFAYLAGSFCVAFPASGWLISFLVMFPDWLLLNVYHWLWLRCCVFQTGPSRFDLALCSLAVVTSVLIDRFIISPFTAMLFII